ncbi:MAG: hypothetical protein AAGA99_18960 [Actinomycetota bacterium]
MTSFFRPSFVTAAESRRERIVFTGIAIVVAVAMFLAASGSGSGDPVGEQPPVVVDVGGNVLSVVIGLLVLMPRTRAIGSILAIGNMFVSMYLNYTVDGVDYFVDLIPYNTVTIMLASVLLGHHAADLAHLRGGPGAPRDPGPMSAPG